MHRVVVRLLLAAHRRLIELAEFHLGPVGLVDQHEFFAHQGPRTLELGTSAKYVLDFPRNGYLVGGHSVCGLCRPVVYQPKVGVDGAWPCRYSVAVTCVHCELFVRVDVSTVMHGDLDTLKRVVSSTPDETDERSTYVAAHIHVKHLFNVCPHHAIRGVVRAHARRLPCEDDGTIWRRGGEIGPCHWRSVARNLRAFDEVFECLGRLQSRDSRIAVGRDQVDVLKLPELAGDAAASGESWCCTHDMARHVRAGVGTVVGLVHAVHGGWGNATMMPRQSGLADSGCSARRLVSSLARRTSRAPLRQDSAKTCAAALVIHFSCSATKRKPIQYYVGTKMLRTLPAFGIHYERSLLDQAYKNYGIN